MPWSPVINLSNFSTSLLRAKTRAIFIPVTLFLVMSLGLGCARASLANLDESFSAYDSLSLEIALDKSAYSPGESVLATVRLINLGGHDVTLGQLNAFSLIFYEGGAETERRAVAKPIASSKERLQGPINLQAGAHVERTFLFTQLTESEGPFVTTARYGSSVARDAIELPDTTASKEIVRIVAEPTSYTVKGERVFRRDSGGLLEKSNAIDLCRSRVGETGGKLDAVLITNEAGFVDWWVFHEDDNFSRTKEDRAVDLAERAWIVNPYLGVIRSGAEPPPPEMQKGDTHYRITHRWAGEDPS